MSQTQIVVTPITARGITRTLVAADLVNHNYFLNVPRGRVIVEIANASDTNDLIATFDTPGVLEEGDADPGLSVENPPITIGPGVCISVGCLSWRFEQLSPNLKKVNIAWSGDAVAEDVNPVTVGAFSIG